MYWYSEESVSFERTSWFVELFVMFESFLFVPPRAGSQECLRVLKRLGSNKPVCEKWPSSKLM